jgi:hypothetical protein
MTVMMLHRLASLLWVLALPLGVSAHEPEQQAVVKTYTAALSPDHQVVGTATCPPGMVLRTGGYKLLDATLSMRALVVVENRPVLQAQEWRVSLLYDPAPGEAPQGNLTLQISALCQSVRHHTPPQMGKHDL